MIEIKLDPELWKDIDPGTEGLVDAWRVEEGERVQAGQALVTVILVKTTQELAAPKAGTVTRILVPAEANFKQGQTLALLDDSI